MKILILLGIVLLLALALNVIDKIRHYRNYDNRSIWQDGDSVIVKHKNAENVGGGFGKRLDQ